MIQNQITVKTNKTTSVRTKQTRIYEIRKDVYQCMSLSLDEREIKFIIYNQHPKIEQIK